MECKAAASSPPGSDQRGDAADQRESHPAQPVQYSDSALSDVNFRFCSVRHCSDRLTLTLNISPCQHDDLYNHVMQMMAFSYSQHWMPDRIQTQHFQIYCLLTFVVSPENTKCKFYVNVSTGMTGSDNAASL